jgi:diguanylate cyclase (GGDEF)-like protein/putative nucleotidyltransferase with HDIG domain
MSVVSREITSATGAGSRPSHLGRRFLPSSVRTLVIGGFGLLVFVLALVTLGASWQVRQNQADLSKLDHHSTMASLLQTAEAQASIAAEVEQRYVYAGNDVLLQQNDPGGGKPYPQEINEAASNAQHALDTALASGGPQGLVEVTSTGAQLMQGASQAVQLRQAGDAKDALAVLEQSVPVFHTYRLQLEALTAGELDQVEQLRARANSAGNLAFLLIVTSGSFGIVLGLAASFWIARSIIKPLASLEATAHRASQGDLTVRAPTTGPREFAHLGSVLNEMMGSIEERSADLSNANRELNQKNLDLIHARNEAATDPLTGLGNHRSFQSRLREEVATARKAGSSVSLIIMDLDGFKDVNDSLGHLVGDQLLRDLAAALTAVTRDDNTFRYGGDELAILLPGVVSVDAVAVAHRLKETVARVGILGGQPVTASLGVACFPQTAKTPEELVRRADMAMYWAKAAGKNRVVVWDTSLTDDPDSGQLRYISGRRDQTDVLGTISAAIAAKDPATAEHSERCSWYTAALAAELGLSGDDVATARLASLLHDIGKLVVPDDILRKAGPLTDDEAERMRQHPADGANMLTQVPSLARAVPGILHHHEHFDGSGYPDGLAGKAIPIVARILLVSDAFDSMTTEGPSAKAISPNAAISELRRQGGSQFDPDVVEAFARLISRSGGFPGRRAAERAVARSNA